MLRGKIKDDGIGEACSARKGNRFLKILVRKPEG
jgi:hypothetical protein